MTRIERLRGRWLRIVPTGLALVFAASSMASQLQPLNDAELADVRGSDGLAFNLSGFSLQGPLTVTYTAPNGASLSLGNLALSRSDDPTATFSDPYTLNVIARPGLSDAIELREPANANRLLKWQFAADWSVNADGTAFDGGALVINDWVSRGATLTLAPPATAGVEGIGFGLALNLDIGSVAWQPRGRSDASQQMLLSGVHLHAASADGTLLDAPWSLADVTNQPGIVNAETDAQGNSYLHIGIGWPTTAAGAPMAGLLIDNLVFKSAELPGGQLDLGSSRIGTMQLQYVDIRLRPGQ